MNRMDLEDIVMKLNGPVDPVGDSNTDAKRLTNLKSLCELVDRLVYHIDMVASDPGEHMDSVLSMKKYANKFLDELGIVE